MGALETAETAVSKLSPKDFAQFRRWFSEYDGKIWDDQIEADAASGKLDALANEALDEDHAGKATEI